MGLPGADGVVLFWLVVAPVGGPTDPEQRTVWGTHIWSGGGPSNM